MADKYKIGNCCPKCGERGAKSTFRKLFVMEFITRDCRNCGAKWFEEPLDKITGEN